MATTKAHQLDLSKNYKLFEKFKQLSTKSSSGKKFLEKLLSRDGKSAVKLNVDGNDAHSRKTSTWVPKIGLDTDNMSVEIDVGSQVVVVNLSDFYKQKDGEVRIEEPVHSVELETADDGDGNQKKATEAMESNLDLLASTANMMVQGSGDERGGRRVIKGEVGAVDNKKYSCALCNCICGSQMMLKFHYGSVHGTVLHSCRSCNQSFLRKRDLEKHVCNTVISGVKNGGVKEEPMDMDESASHRPKSVPKARSSKSAISPITDPLEGAGPATSGDKAVGGIPRKEAYVCRVCQSKFREPTQVLKHLKKFHKEHARKAWIKFQENLKQRKQPEIGPSSAMSASSSNAANGEDEVDPTFSVRALSETRLKLKVNKPPRPEKPPKPPKPPKAKKPPGPPKPKKSGTSNNTNPGYVTCGVCLGTKYYTFTMQCRKFGSYTCESCKKFATRFSQNPVRVKCDRETGNCHIPVLIPRHSAKRRCRACWLKKCLGAFNMPEVLHNRLRSCLPMDMQVDVPLGHMKEFVVTGKVMRDSDRYKV